MDNDGKKSNVVHLYQEIEEAAEESKKNDNSEDVCEFIAEMLDALMMLAAKSDYSMLVYFLSMAREESLEVSRKQK